jgi:hypothetical protein
MITGPVDMRWIYPLLFTLSLGAIALWTTSVASKEVEAKLTKDVIPVLVNLSERMTLAERDIALMRQNSTHMANGIVKATNTTDKNNDLLIRIGEKIGIDKP